MRVKISISDPGMPEARWVHFAGTITDAIERSVSRVVSESGSIVGPERHGWVVVVDDGRACWVRHELERIAEQCGAGLTWLGVIEAAEVS